MDGDTSAWASVLYNWAPILLVIAFWLIIMRKMRPGGHAKYLERRLASMDRQEQLLERIANALERRNARRLTEEAVLPLSGTEAEASALRA